MNPPPGTEGLEETLSDIFAAADEYAELLGFKGNEKLVAAILLVAYSSFCRHQLEESLTDACERLLDYGRKTNWGHIA